MRRIVMAGIGVVAVVAAFGGGRQESIAPAKAPPASLGDECRGAINRLVDLQTRRRREIAAAESALGGGVIEYEGIFGGFIAGVEADARNAGNYAIEEELKRNLVPIDRDIEELTTFVMDRCAEKAVN
jgi:hypothetical protein